MRPFHRVGKIVWYLENALADYGALPIGIMTLNMKGLMTTLSINDTQHNNTAITKGVIMLSDAFYLL